MSTPIPGPHADPIPTTDEGLRAFGVQFGASWVPATFNVVAPLAAAVVAASTAFGNALAVVSDPSTRTTPAIAAKNEARIALVSVLRTCIRAAQAAYLAGTASEEDLTGIGVRPNSLVRTPISAPQYPPQVSIDSVAVGSTNLRVTQVDQISGLAVSTRGFAYGIIGVFLERKVGAGPWTAVGLRKTVKINDITEGLASGTLLMYRARYQTARGLVLSLIHI